MTHAAYKVVCHRRQVYRRYENTIHPAYIRAAKRAKVLVNNARRLFEEKLAKKIKEDRKSFFLHLPEVEVKVKSVAAVCATVMVIW